MIHISEISTRYVRDARGLLSIGQVVRARVLDASGPRVELSLKDVPEFVRAPRPPEERPARREPARTRRREAPEERQEKWSEQEPVLRAARTRRDGLGGTGAGGDRRRERSGRGAGKGDKRGGRRQYQDEGFDAAAVRKAQSPAGSYNPFAQFFKRKLEGEASAEG
jgi:predicted RNA-binding protein with RPS1 domain